MGFGRRGTGQVGTVGCGRTTLLGLRLGCCSPRRIEKDEAEDLAGIDCI
ncbi:unnamed protein product [Chondrus crispus]|uniref:Uncharacterized protein n=1 Tax=Chondrus crispus TaxID=2769 RepID=R7QKW1_CHOCR|nr:unnamed protein product [Chondrus crispus]CDF38010.1 unnamed protein product [Chondrus crispus]|eukprot:XP_005717879.1 unnamed protein product [Chondrus crispus]